MQFGKNHLSDCNHLDAMSDPFWYSYPSARKFFQTYGPRNLGH